MAPVAKAVLLCLGAAVVPFVGAIVATVVVAGATSRLGASGVGPWLVGLLLLELCLFGVSSLVLFHMLGSHLQGAGKVGVFLAHLVVQLGLLAATAFVSVVVFNR